MSIRAVTFDFWGTLFRDQDSAKRHQMRVEAFAAAAALTHEVVDEALHQVQAEFFRVHVEEQRILAPLDAVRMAGARLAVEFAPEIEAGLARIFATAILHHPPALVEGALKAVRWAAERFPVALICDSGISPGSSLEVLLEQHGFTNYLRVRTYSDAVGVAKPQAAMFQRTAEQLGVAPAELFHIGDLEPTDVAGIHGVGGVAALFAGVNTRFAETTSAEYTFHRWQDFVDGMPHLV
ncbi:MAG: HAD family hydrolase [Candidatus Hydrogenedentes bacterium]|nr:HAD family hydrolase [Candidatus Hydrogenedentota bacterium]